MNPELIKSVIASGSTNRNPVDWRKSFSVPSSPKEDRSTSLPSLPLLNPALRSTPSEDSPETAPLTIFYNGMVSVINVPRDKAESIFKLAVEGSSKNIESVDSSKAANPSSDQQSLLEARNGDLPIARRKSLQRFLEKRKESGLGSFVSKCQQVLFLDRAKALSSTFVESRIGFMKRECLKATSHM
ncbi:hypothetical protein Golax_017438 [Gossypium laxum]|uniref:Protein TIFY n=1 Tax=Gossypium laxum TaxID=34288 RepID=A0A7J8Z0W7_9ROSI|nr:hypothetical protein [Gossypium laxum]